EAVRQACAAALGRLERTLVLPLLVAALGSPRSEVRAAASQALNAAGEGRLAAAIEAIWMGDAGPAIAVRDRYAFEPLLAALRSSRSTARRAAAAALGRLREPRAMGPLMEVMVNDPDPAAGA